MASEAQRTFKGGGGFSSWSRVCCVLVPRNKIRFYKLNVETYFVNLHLKQRNGFIEFSNFLFHEYYFLIAYQFYILNGVYDHLIYILI